MNSLKMNVFLSRHILPLIIMLANLAIAYDLDRWREVLRQQNALTANLSTLVLWSYTISGLLMAAALLAQFAWIIYRPQRSQWAAAIYILIGLFFSAYPVLYFSPVAWLVGPLVEITSFPAYLLTAGAFIAITGVAILVIPRRLFS
jgi:hypothetical protein